ncbi:MAG: hypothetical protein GY898_11485 [Proteobacteria bacterium]|nr:hypothetical protein [Pseudomonadota bacterium]
MIELLITVALSTLVGILIYTVFIEQTRAYRLQTDMGNMQQNLRVAMEMVTRDVATAGWGVGYNGSTWGIGGQDGDENSGMYAIWVRDNFPVGSGHDAIELTMMDPDRTTWGYTATDVSEQCSTTVITFDADDAAVAGNFSSAGPNSEIICYAPVGMGGRPVSYIWTVDGTGDTSSGTVPVAANTTTDFSNECTGSLPAHMACGPVMHQAYYIDDNGSDGFGIGSSEVPVLYLVPDVTVADIAGGYPHANDIPVALGIEDLQFQVCQAGLGRDCEDDANWESGFNMDANSSGTSDWWNLQAVRVLMTARTLRPDLERTAVSTPIDIEPLDVYVPTATLDSYHRRVARTEVTSRNAMGTWQMMNTPF